MTSYISPSQKRDRSGKTRKWRSKLNSQNHVFVSNVIELVTVYLLNTYYSTDRYLSSNYDDVSSAVDCIEVDHYKKKVTVYDMTTGLDIEEKLHKITEKKQQKTKTDYWQSMIGCYLQSGYVLDAAILKTRREILFPVIEDVLGCLMGQQMFDHAAMQQHILKKHPSSLWDMIRKETSPSLTRQVYNYVIKRLFTLD